MPSTPPTGHPQDAGATGTTLRSADAARFFHRHRVPLGLLLFALIVRLATLGAYPLMDNTEARYAEIARKMIETGDWVTPQFRYGVPFWSKPPLSIWLTSLSYGALGVSEFTARLPSLVCCVVIAWLTCALAVRKLGREIALKAALVLCTTPLFFISAGAVMTDAALVVGTTLSMVGFWEAVRGREGSARTWGMLFFVGLAVGLLAKGPVGAVLTFVPVGVWTLWKGTIRTVWRKVPWVSGLVLTAVLVVPWYALAEARTPGFLDYFLVGEHWKRYTVTGWKGDMFGTAHSTPRGTIWLLAIASTLPWCLVWGLLALILRRQSATVRAQPTDDGWRAYLWLWMLAPAVFFTFAGNILFTYVLPGLPAFALLAAQTWEAAGDSVGWRKAVRFHALVVPTGVLLVVFLALPRVASTNSHQDLVARYQSLRKGAEQRLVYLREAPHSAEFYSRGKVVTVASTDELQRYLDDAPRDFFALKDADLQALPEVRDRLTEIARYGRYRLLEEKPAAAAKAP